MSGHLCRDCLFNIYALVFVLSSSFYASTLNHILSRALPVLSSSFTPTYSCSSASLLMEMIKPRVPIASGNVCFRY